MLDSFRQINCDQFIAAISTISEYLIPFFWVPEPGERLMAPWGKVWGDYSRDEPKETGTILKGGQFFNWRHTGIFQRNFIPIYGD